MELKTLTIKEGVLRALDGEDIIVMIPSQLTEHSVEDLRVLGRSGAFCVRHEELEPKKAPEPHPDNDVSLEVVHDEEPDLEPEKPKKPKVDMGKIKALADAGWSVQKIAGEMGLSGPTIRRYLKEGLGE